MGQIISSVAVSVFLTQSKNSAHLMALKSSSSSSHQPTIGPHPLPGESNPRPNILFL